MIYWGISAGYHDASLAVIQHSEDAKLLFAAHSERYSKYKNDKHLCQEIVDDALQYGQPDRIVWYETPWKKTLRHLKAGQGFKYTSPSRYMKPFGITCPVNVVDHHYSHAAAGFGTSKFVDAMIVVIDSIGEFDTASIWYAKETKGVCEYNKLWSMKYPKSIGLFYSAMTQRVGKKPNEEEYITMGMAALGKPLYTPDLLNLYNKGFNFHKGCLDWNKCNTVNAFDIAASAQQAFEILVKDIINRAKSLAKSHNLVFMGGCALNCVMNSKIEGWDNIWIMPNPGDAGSSIGSVLAYLRTKINFDTPYLGTEIKGQYPVEPLLHELTHKGIVGVANGRAEFGPRALGNRSLLADPRRPDVKDLVNRIKKREPYRPFAPAILAEHANDYFDGPTSPYMQYTSTCKFPDQFPAIIHVDGTSRVQTVSEQDNPGFRKLLEKWYQQTGCPMLLNTSLNIKGQPLVNDFQDAINFQKKYKVKVF